MLYVGVGGFLGSILRYIAAQYLKTNWPTLFPTGTFLVNLTGSFLIGIIIAATLTENLNQQTRLLWATGFCGGFTTFSSFSYEFFALLQEGHTGYAFLYATSSMILGLLLVWLGFSLGKMI